MGETVAWVKSTSDQCIWKHKGWKGNWEITKKEHWSVRDRYLKSFSLSSLQIDRESIVYKIFQKYLWNDALILAEGWRMKQLWLRI